MTRAIAVTLVAALSLGAVATVAASDDRNEADAKVSTLTNGRCGHLEDSLPALVTRNGIAPGEVAADVTVCVANAGDEDAVLTLGAAELVELDHGCTGAEPTADQTCGQGRRGELGASLLQQAGIGSCPAVPGTTPLERRLTQLGPAPLVLSSRLRENQLVCVRLRLRYQPPDAAAAVASQSDRTFWRYAFVVTER